MLWRGHFPRNVFSQNQNVFFGWGITTGSLGAEEFVNPELLAPVHRGQRSVAGSLFPRKQSGIQLETPVSNRQTGYGVSPCRNAQPSLAPAQTELRRSAIERMKRLVIERVTVSLVESFG